MNITVTRSYENPASHSVQSFVASEIDRASMGSRGQIECLADEHGHLAKSFARLVETLATKGLLTAPEVVRIACHYDADPDAAFS